MATQASLNFPVTKLYRDCLRLADYISLKTGNRQTLRQTVSAQFRRNAQETDPKKTYLSERCQPCLGFMDVQTSKLHPLHKTCYSPVRRKQKTWETKAATKSSWKKKNKESKSVEWDKNTGIGDGEEDLWEDEEDEEMEINHAALEKEAQEFAESFNASQTTSLVDLWDTEGSEMLFTTEESPSAENEIGTQTQSGKRGRKRIDRGIGRPKDSSIPLEALPKVAIVGRPNVGKSALFNRITGSNMAIVYDYPGVTRDRMYTRAVWGDKEFVVVDTGGLMSDATKLPSDKMMKAIRGISDVNLPQAIERQAAAGVSEADSLILVVDGQDGLTSSDEEIMSWLRRTHPDKPVTLAVNKCENVRIADTQAAEFWALGIEPLPVSAISGTGSGELMEKLTSTLPPPKTDGREQEARDLPIPLAIVGRPNVGKSSLLNALVGSERSIVSSVSGTTRDAVDTEVVTPEGKRFSLIDTAGIRKRAAVSDSTDGAEPLSVQRAVRAVRRSQVVLLVLDGEDCTVDGRFVVTQQDFRLSELVAAEGRACVIAINKWDAVPDKDTHTLLDYQKEVLYQLRHINWATVIFTSALSGQRVNKILETVALASEEHSRRISTATMNMVIAETMNWRQPPTSRGGKRGKIYYAVQAAVRPPTFVFFVNDATIFGEDYRRYVERQLRDNIGFPGSPIRIYWRGKTPRAQASRPRRRT